MSKYQKRSEELNELLLSIEEAAPANREEIMTEEQISQWKAGYLKVQQLWLKALDEEKG